MSKVTFQFRFTPKDGESIDIIREYLREDGRYNVILIVEEWGTNGDNLHYHGMLYGNVKSFRDWRTSRFGRVGKGKGNDQHLFIGLCNKKGGPEGLKRYFCKGKSVEEGPVVIDKDDFTDVEAYHLAFYERHVAVNVEDEKAKRPTVPIWLRAKLTFQRYEEEICQLLNDDFGNSHVTIGERLIEMHRENDWFMPSRTQMFEMVCEIQKKGTKNNGSIFYQNYYKMWM